MLFAIRTASSSRGEAEDGGDRAERFLVRDPGLLGHGVEHGRKVVRALGPVRRAPAPREHLGRAVAGVRDQGLHAVDGPGVDERPDLGRSLRSAGPTRSVLARSASAAANRSAMPSATRNRFEAVQTWPE